MDPNDIAALESRFGIPGEVSFAEGPNGMPVVEVSNEKAMAIIALQGGHLLSWAPHAQEPVIWLSPRAKFGPGQSVRGGIPVCWPWFGPHPIEPSLPAHGFARTTMWEVIEATALDEGPDRLGFRLIQDEASFAQWPHSSPVEIRHVIDAALEIELRTRNREPKPLTLSEALHTYFHVSDVRNIAIHGLDGCEYLDKVDGGRRKRQSGPVTFDGETDRVYLDTAADCLIEDAGLSRRIRIEKQGSSTTVVWNPWVEKAARMSDFEDDGYLRMVCVESANAAENQITLGPGEEHRLSVRYSIERMS